MKMLMLMYSGDDPQRISSLLDGVHAGGYSEFRNVHGSGTTGKREGSRAWPGEATFFVSVVPDERADAVVGSLRRAATTLPTGSSLHVAVLPTETFF